MNKNTYPCKQIWRLMVPDAAVGASKVFFDLFNATSSTADTGNRIVVSSVKVMVAIDVANAAAVGANIHLHKTTAVGTGGTAATTQGTSNTACTFTTLTPDPGALPDGITARLLPTGGATLGAWVSQSAVALEELNHGALVEKWLLHPVYDEAIVLRQSEGLKVIQGTVAAAGSIGFIVTFGILEQ